MSPRRPLGSAMFSQILPSRGDSSPLRPVRRSSSSRYSANPMARAPGGETLHQVVVPAALEHRPRRAGHIAGKDQAVVILHLIGQAQVQLCAAAFLPQPVLQRLQFFQRFPLGFAAAGGPGRRDGSPHRAVQRQQAAQRLRRAAVQSGSQCSSPEFVGVLAVQQFQQAAAGRGWYFQRVQQAGDEPHVADFQHRGHFQRGQAFQRQPHHLRLGGGVHRPHTFQPHLVDGLEGVALPAGAADFLVVVKAPALAGGGLGRLGDGQRHVRLDGPQLAVQVGKGDDLGIRQKALVLLVQGVFLKAGAAVLAVTRLLIQRAQAQHGLLGGGKILQLDLHLSSCLSDSQIVLPIGKRRTFAMTKMRLKRLVISPCSPVRPSRQNPPGRRSWSRRTCRPPFWALPRRPVPPG